MEQKVFAKIIAQRLGIAENNVAGVLALLEEGCTIPFIARYRKERTGGLDEVKIAAISDQFDKLKEMAKRKAAFDWKFDEKAYPRYLRLFVKNVGSMAHGGIWE